MDAEISELKSNLANIKTEKISGIEFSTGTFSGNEVVVAKCGIGKVFAAICTETMILKYNPQNIIHIGIAGSLCDNLTVHDVAIASEVVQHDYDQTAFGMKKGEIQGLDLINIPCDKKMVSDLITCAEKINVKYKVGVIASGDQFIVDSKKKENLVKDFDAIAVEMEGASTGQVCYVNGVAFAVVRSISDGSSDDTDTYKGAKQSAADIATKLIFEYLS